MSHDNNKPNSLFDFKAFAQQFSARAAAETAVTTGVTSVVVTTFIAIPELRELQAQTGHMGSGISFKNFKPGSLGLFGNGIFAFARPLLRGNFIKSTGRGVSGDPEDFAPIIGLSAIQTAALAPSNFRKALVGVGKNVPKPTTQSSLWKMYATGSSFKFVKYGTGLSLFIGIEPVANRLKQMIEAQYSQNSFAGRHADAIATTGTTLGFGLLAAIPAQFSDIPYNQIIESARVTPTSFATAVTSRDALLNVLRNPRMWTLGLGWSALSTVLEFAGAELTLIGMNRLFHPNAETATSVSQNPNSLFIGPVNQSHLPELTEDEARNLYSA